MERGRASMELNHYSHEHPLVLSEESYFFHNYRCSACRDKIVGLSYCCVECRYVLHKWCAHLPPKLTNHLHPEHPLLLEFSKQDSEEGSEKKDFSKDCLEEEDKEDSVCKSCKNPIDGDTVYHCTQCTFNLHAGCATLPKKIMLDMHDPYGTKSWLTFKHIREWTPTYVCSFCKESGDGSRFVTVLEDPSNEPTEIGFSSWHIECAIFPEKVKHERHRHDLTLHPPIEKDMNYDECYCDACEQERDPRAWVYYCEPCEYAAHIGCGIAGLDRPKQNILFTHPIYEDPEEQLKRKEIEKRKTTDHEVDYIKMEEERRKERILEDRRGLEERKHFSHEHPLILYNEKWNERVWCEACRIPIYGNTYICNDCNFYLHVLCAELPDEINHRLHSEHPLTLMPCDGLSTVCKYCRKLNNCFSFSCKECDFGLHTTCAMLPENPIHHEGHEHPLPLVNHKGFSRYPLRCNACRELCGGPMLWCNHCPFYLHLVCALYPRTGKAMTHRHSLTLNYSFQEDPNALEFICDACEKPRPPNCWLYSCPDANCYFVAHLDCASPKPIQNFNELGFDQFYKLRFPM